MQNISQEQQKKGWGALLGPSVPRILVKPQFQEPELVGAKAPITNNPQGEWSKGTIVDVLKQKETILDNVRRLDSTVEEQLAWLSAAFSCIDREVILHVVEDCNYNISTALVTLTEMVAVSIQHQLDMDEAQQRAAADSKSAAADLGSLDQARAAARELSRKAQNLYKQANQAYQKRQFSAGNALTKQASLLQEEADHRSREMGVKILAAKNAGNELTTLDLHGLYASEVGEIVDARLKELESSSYQHHSLDVIVGKGKHSQNHQPVIPSVVESLLIEQGRKFVKKEGVITVKLVPHVRQHTRSWEGSYVSTVSR